MLFSTKKSWGPVSSDRLIQAERRFGIRLPEEYRTFLLTYNGGHPTPDCFRYKSESGPYTDSDVAWFFGVHDGRFENFESKFNLYKVMNHRIPEDLMPIGSDSGGNLICLAFTGPRKGKVYFWDHEAEGEEPGYRNCHLLADSLQEFLDGLHELPKAEAE